MAGYALSIAGSPYVFGSAGVTTLPTSTDGSWSTDWTLAAGFFDWEASNLSWTERIKPLDGDLDVGGLTFVLRDQTATSGPLAGYPLLGRLATRDDSLIASTTLSASATTTDATLHVADTSAFAASGVLWLEREAISYTGTTATTFTGCTRGVYGTNKTTHDIDGTQLLYPECWAELPWATRRLVILWRVDDANVATALWRGVGQRTPRLRGGSGGLFEVQCSDAWTVERDLTFVDPNVSCKLRGYNSHAFDFGVSFDRAGVASYFSGATDVLTKVYTTLSDVCGRHQSRLRTWITDDGVATSVDLTVAARAGRVEYAIGESSAGAVSISLDIAAAGPTGVRSTETADPRTASLAVDAPPLAVLASFANADQRVPVDRVAGFPASWGATSTLAPDPATGPYATTIQPVLMGAYDDGLDLVFKPSAATANDTTIDPAGPTITALLEVRARTPEIAANGPRRMAIYQTAPGRFFDPRTDDTGATWLVNPTTLTLSAHIQTDNWVYGLQAALSDTTTLRTGSDAQLWDWSAADLAADAIADGAARDLYLGGDTLGTTIPSLCALHGCAIAVRAGGKLAIVPIRRAVANETAVATLAKTDLVEDKTQTWEVLPDGLANVASVTAEQVTLNVRDANSVGRYGQARTIKLSALGVTDLEQDYRRLSQNVLSRVLHLWSQPVKVAKLPLNLSWISTIYLGDQIAVSEDLLPDGATGGRGLGNATALATFGVAAQYGYVLGRTVDIAGGVLWLEVILFPACVAYAPCVRVASSPSATTVTAATAFVRGASDYTGGADAQGGAGYFVAGDVVRFVQRDVTTHTTYGPYTVQSVSGTTITFTGALDAALRTSIALGTTIWDLRFDDYGNGSTLQTAQKRWAWVGGASSRVLASSTDRAKRWGP